MYNHGINMKENLGSARLCLFSSMHACIHSLHQSLLLLLIGFTINTNLKSLRSFEDYFRYHLSRPHWSLFLSNSHERQYCFSCINLDFYNVSRKMKLKGCYGLMWNRESELNLMIESYYLYEHSELISPVCLLVPR